MRFEDLRVWKAARELTRSVYVTTNENKLSKDFGLKDQKLPDGTFRYGVRTSKGETTKQAFEAGQKFGIAAYRQMRNEAVYTFVPRLNF